MAVLVAADRIKVRNHFMRLGLSFAVLTKPDLQAAVDATDAFIDANAAAYNAALPLAARTNLTALQKLLLFCYVAMRRAGLLTTEEG